MDDGLAQIPKLPAFVALHTHANSTSPKSVKTLANPDQPLVAGAGRDRDFQPGAAPSPKGIGVDRLDFIRRQPSTSLRTNALQLTPLQACAKRKNLLLTHNVPDSAAKHAALESPTLDCNPALPEGSRNSLNLN